MSDILHKKSKLLNDLEKKGKGKYFVLCYYSDKVLLLMSHIWVVNMVCKTIAGLCLVKSSIFYYHLTFCGKLNMIKYFALCKWFHFDQIMPIHIKTENTVVRCINLHNDADRKQRTNLQMNFFPAIS